MARISLFSSNFSFQHFFSKIPIHQKHGAKPPAADIVRLVKSGGLFVLAIATAFLAREMAETDGAESYLQNHWPPGEWLDAGLRSSGYEKVTDDRKREAWIKWLPPSALEARGISADLAHETLILVDRPASIESTPQNADTRIEVWRCGTSPSTSPPKQWNHLGLGWAGVVQIRKCSAKSAPQGSISGHSRRNLVDPKEIRY